MREKSVVVEAKKAKEASNSLQKQLEALESKELAQLIARDIRILANFLRLQNVDVDHSDFIVNLTEGGTWFTNVDSDEVIKQVKELIRTFDRWVISEGMRIEDLLDRLLKNWPHEQHAHRQAIASIRRIAEVLGVAWVDDLSDPEKRRQLLSDLRKVRKYYVLLFHPDQYVNDPEVRQQFDRTLKLINAAISEIEEYLKKNDSVDFQQASETSSDEEKVLRARSLNELAQLIANLELRNSKGVIYDDEKIQLIIKSVKYTYWAALLGADLRRDFNWLPQDKAVRIKAQQLFANEKRQGKSRLSLVQLVRDGYIQTYQEFSDFLYFLGEKSTDSAFKQKLASWRLSEQDFLRWKTTPASEGQQRGEEIGASERAREIFNNTTIDIPTTLRLLSGFDKNIQVYFQRTKTDGSTVVAYYSVGQLIDLLRQADTLFKRKVIRVFKKPLHEFAVYIRKHYPAVSLRVLFAKAGHEDWYNKFYAG